MKTHKLVMFALVLFSVSTAAAQQKNTQPSQGPVVTKGYYAIGKNSEKLGTPAVLPTKATTQQGAAKGYFTGSNRNKLGGQAAYLPQASKRPVATKGYYSIGTNAGKLTN